MKIRLNKYLAHLGIASRRSADQLIESGKVLVNGERAKLGFKLDPEKDKVEVKGKLIRNSLAELEYYAVYKPVGFVSTTNDPHNRHAVTSLIKTKTRLYPVGRLDKDSEGLVILTNDGELTHHLTHPKHHVAKTYEIVLAGKFTPQKLGRLKKGVRLKDGITAPSEIEVISEQNRQTKINITLYEGKNRQIRRMATAVKLEVLKLKRISIGPVTIGNLRSGDSRPLSPPEISSLSNLDLHS